MGSKRYLKMAGVLGACAIVVVALGQACGPAFTTLESASVGASALLTDNEKAACAAVAAKPSITSITTFVAYVNSLPRPVKLACVIMNLPRPLYVNATASASSAQPALSARDPRIFIRIGSSVLAIVTDGSAVNSLEYSQAVGSNMWERADFRFPVTDTTLTESAGLDHLAFGSGTSCGLCHTGETFSRSVNGSSIFKSQLQLPAASQNVSISAMRAEVTACQANNDASDRCLLYRSLFDGGSVLPFSF